ncbi:hypothetical protein FOA52_009441 [Chlamydomonas sp. UWO 241]|nr:hypothetical protein FOA52_009441 [Chlamydomonas sp. UWO 241]
MPPPPDTPQVAPHPRTFSPAPQARCSLQATLNTPHSTRGTPPPHLLASSPGALLSTLHTRVLALRMLCGAGGGSGGGGGYSGAVGLSLADAERRLVVQAAGLAVRCGHLDTAEELLLPYLPAATGRLAPLQALPVLQAAVALHVAQSRDTPDREVTPRPVRSAVSTLFRLQLPADSSGGRGSVAVAECELALSKGCSLAELARWKTDAVQQGKQMSIALAQLKNAARLAGVLTSNTPSEEDDDAMLPTPAASAGPPAPAGGGAPGTSHLTASASADLATRASMALASWCLRLLSPQDEDGIGEGAASLSPAMQGELQAEGGLVPLTVRHLLLAMRGGSSHGVAARLQTPLLLDLMGSHPDACTEFEAGWDSLPRACLMPWASQMLSRLGSGTEGPALAAPLAALAQAHPQRLYCPVRLAHSAWQASTQSAPSTPAEARYQQLLQLTGGETVMAEFVDALNALTFPTMRWAWHSQALVRAMEAGGTARARATVFGHMFATAGTTTAPPRVPAAAAGAHPGGGGPAPVARAPTLHRDRAGAGHAAAPRATTINAQFAKRFGRIFWERFGGAGGEALAPGGSLSSLLALRECLSALDAQVAQAAGGPGGADGQHGTRTTATFTPWFEAFSKARATGPVSGGGGVDDAPTAPLPGGLRTRGASASARRLLLPSMLCALDAPSGGGGGGVDDEMTGGGVEVVGFGRQVHVFKSKQKPKRLTLHCSDFSTVEVLVKGGEDLRIDARIQQLFTLLNGLAQHHAGCASRQLAVTTFDVVPVSPSCGLIGFVPGVQPLSEVVESAAQRNAPKAAVDIYREHIYGRGAPEGLNAKHHMRNFERMDAAKAAAGLACAQEKLPWGLLRGAVLGFGGGSGSGGGGGGRGGFGGGGGAGPEAALARRAKFASTLAAVCAFGWFAGVGDRHPQNLVVHAASGALVPIDFGYSFGTATAFLQVPELVPFRLTRQMLGVLQPHDGVELLVAPITELLRCMRASRQVLGSVLGIFCRKPPHTWWERAWSGSCAEWQKEARLDMAQAAGGAPAAAAVHTGCSGGGGDGSDAPSDVAAGGGGGPPDANVAGGGGGGGGGARSGDASGGVAGSGAMVVDAGDVDGSAGLPPCSSDMLLLAEARHAAFKVEGSLRKLRLAHPSLIVIDELARRHSRAAYWPGLKAVVTGRESGAGSGTAAFSRASVPLDQPCADEEQQARCLLDLATDPNVLGRAYEGWKPFL